MKTRLPWAFAAVAMLAAPLLVGAEEVRLKLHHLMPPVAPGHWAMLEPWARKIEEESDGRIRIDIFPSMHLGGQPPALIDQAREGVVDIVWTLPGYTPGRFPRIEVFELPFMSAHPVVMNLAMQDFIDNHPEEFAEYKVISLFVHAGQLIHSTVPVRTVDQLRGLKIRIPTRVAGWMVESWGAVPLGTTVQKIPEMLSKRIVDGTLIPFEASYALRVHELVDYHVFLDDPVSQRFNAQVLIIAMNRDRYEALPADLKAVIDANSGRNIAQWIAAVWTGSEAPGEEAARASGEFIYLPPAEVEKLRARSQEPVAQRWIDVVGRRGIDGRALVREATELLDRYQRYAEEQGLLPD